MGKIAPIDANGDDTMKLARDNWNWGDYWILTDGHTVTIAEQKFGEQAISITRIPKHIFTRFCKWYMTGATR